MTAKELAAACEMSEMGLSKILTGRSKANTSTIIRIAKELDVSCGELFDDYKTPEPIEIHSVIINGIEYVPKPNK